MTPRCFAAWSKGKSDLAQRRIEDAIALSWLTGVRTAEAMAGKPQKLETLLARAKPKRPQTTDEMLAVFMALQDRGAPLNIKKLN